MLEQVLVEAGAEDDQPEVVLVVEGVFVDEGDVLADILLGDVGVDGVELLLVYQFGGLGQLFSVLFQQLRNILPSHLGAVFVPGCCYSILLSHHFLNYYLYFYQGKRSLKPLEEIYRQRVVLEGGIFGGQSLRDG